MAGVAAVVVAALALAAPALVVSADRSVGGLAVGHATVAQAVAKLGPPTSEKRAGGGVTCDVAWRGLGLTASFLDFQGHGCRAGVLVTATIRHRARWRTERGLRVGDPERRVRALYPKARLRTGPSGYWLVPRRACAETGGAAYPGLLAQVRGGRVSALVVTAGVCE